MFNEFCCKSDCFTTALQFGWYIYASPLEADNNGRGDRGHRIATQINSPGHRTDNNNNPLVGGSEISISGLGERNRNGFGKHDFFIQSHSKKRKTHYVKDIRPTLSDWMKIDPSPYSVGPGLHFLSFGLYTDVTGQIRSLDKSGKTLAHLNDRRYSQAKKKYDEIDSADRVRNRFVSESVHELEKSMEYAFSNLGIQEIQFNRNEFYRLTFIVRAFKAASLEKTLPSLIKDYKPISGDYYTTFTLAGFPIAQCRTYRDYRINQIIKSELEKNAKNMKQIEDDMNKIQSSLDGFKEEINKIIDDADRTGLKGKCIYEIQEWKFFHCRRFPLEGVQ